MPSARSAAVAVLLVLAFGVAIGSAVAPPSQGAAEQTIVLALAPAAQPVATAVATPVATPAPTVAPSPEPTPEDTSTPEPTATATVAPKPKATPTATPTPTAPPAIEHVFLVVLAGDRFGDAFGAGSKATYLAKTLREQGELVPNYAAVAGGDLANEVALVSGQDATPAISADCPQYTEDCLYPAAVKTVADQLTAAGKTWRAYVEDQPAGCSHPALGTVDAPAGDYVTWRNPFVYFHSLLDGPDCTSYDLGTDQLSFDLASADTTASLSLIVPDRCHDGSDTPCAPSGLPAADAWLKTIVPPILDSAAYKEGGLLAIASDQGGGLLLVSQQVKPGSEDDVGSYTPYSLLRAIEDLFGLDHLGHAGDATTSGFDSAVYNATG
jgi:hypothetical protein